MAKIVGTVSPEMVSRIQADEKKRQQRSEQPREDLGLKRAQRRVRGKGLSAKRCAGKIVYFRR